MFSYEIRLLDEEGRTSLVFVTVCANDDAAKDKALTLKDSRIARFEVWRDAEKIAEGR